MHDEQARQRSEQRDVREVAHRVEAELGIDRGRDALRDRDNAQRIAVGRRARALLGADVAAAAGAVVGDDLDAPCLGEALGGKAPDDVGRAARRKRDDEAQRLRRVGLRLGRAEPQRRDAEPDLHGKIWPNLAFTLARSSALTSTTFGKVPASFLSYGMQASIRMRLLKLPGR